MTQYIPPQSTDSVEFQTLLPMKYQHLCNAPAFMINDRLDANSFFVMCELTVVRVTIDVEGNETSDTIRPSMGQSFLQVTPESDLHCSTIVQTMDANGSLLLGFSGQDQNSTFGLYDRFGAAVPQFLWVNPNRAAISAVTFAQDPTAVYWIASDDISCKLMLTRLNYSSPSQSSETELPFYIDMHASIAAHPRLPLLYVASLQQLTEYNILTNTSLVLIDSMPGFGTATFSNLAFTHSDEILLACLQLDSIDDQNPPPIVIRIHRASRIVDSILPAGGCSDDIGATALLYAAHQQLLFVVCHSGMILSGSFNGSVADSSSVAVFQTATNPLSPIGGILLLPSETKLRLVLCNPFAETSMSAAPLVMSSGISLASTVNQIVCGTPTLISAHRDELQRRVLLHKCGQASPPALPAVAIDSQSFLARNVCPLFGSLLHRPGTSVIYAHCAVTAGFLSSATVVSIRTDNSKDPQKLIFTCPEEYPDTSRGVYGLPAYMSQTVNLARNESLLITCALSLWLLPLDTPGGGVGSARMLLNLSDPNVVGNVSVSAVNGVQATFTTAFVSVQYVGGDPGGPYWTSVIAAPLDEPQQSWIRPAINWMLDDNSTAAFFDVQQGSSPIMRQDIQSNGAPAGNNVTLFSDNEGSVIAWSVDSLSRQLIVLLQSGKIFMVDAYAKSDNPPVREIAAPAGCIDLEDWSSYYFASYRRLDMLLLSCSTSGGPDWVFMGISTKILLNASAPVEWVPVLRATSSCRELTGPPLLAADGMDLYLQCDGVPRLLTNNFQCAPGQQWSVGQCRDCLPGSSKPTWSLIGGVFNNPQCQTCSSGSIAVAAASFSCAACPIGTAHDVTLGEVCRPCPAGRYTNSSGMSDCLPCPVGTVQPSLGSSSCTPCPLGSLADSNAVTCIPCARGWYTPMAGANAICISCEGSRQEGLTCNNGVASVEEGYFAFLVPDASYGLSVYRTALCPFDNCPGSPLQLPDSVMTESNPSPVWSNCDNSQISSIDYCCWPRLNSADNLLCAQCSEGFVAWGSSCVNCDGPNTLLIIGLVAFVFILVVFLYSNTAQEAGSGTVTPSNPIASSAIATDTSGHIALLLYFVQISSLQLGSASDWLQWLHYANLSAHSTRSCIAPLDAYQQSAINLAVPLILASVLFVLGCAHLLFDRLLRTSAHNDHFSEEMDIRVSLDSAHIRLQPFLQDYDRQSEEHASQYSAVAVVPSPATESSLSPLYGCYSLNTWYWNSLVLLRRMLFAVVVVFLSDNPLTRNAIFVLLHFGSLLLHQLAAPYRNTALNRAEVISYSILLLQVVLLLMQRSTPPYAAWFEICMLLLVVIPVIALLLWMMYIKFGSGRGKSDQPLCKRLFIRFTIAISPSLFSSSRYSATVLSLLLFCYTSVTSTVFAFLRCENLTEDVSLVFQAPTMQCGSDRYKRYELWVILVLSIYVVGFPIASLVVLAWNRRRT